MSVLNAQDHENINIIQKDMEKRGCDIQRNIFTDDGDLARGFVTCFGRTRKYHVYINGTCVVMLPNARALYDYFNDRFGKDTWYLRPQAY